ncbi:MAG: metallophosphoesterase [Bacteroidota bacterium]
MKKHYLLFGLFLPGLLLGQVDKPFFFVQMSDPQFGMYRIGKNFKHERENARKAIAAVNKLHPDFVVVTGDLVNKEGNKKQIAAFKETFAMLDTTIPLYLVPGNHDVGNRPTKSLLQHYRKEFGPDYYSFDRHGVKFIVLNSSLIKDPSRVKDDALHQKKWLQQTLSEASTRNPKLKTPNSPTILFQHHPWFLKRAGEVNGYFNMPKKIRAEYLKLFKELGVKNVFAGHLHANAYGQDKSLEMVTTGPVGLPLGIDPSGIRIVTVRPGSITHQYYALDKIPEHIALDEEGTRR